MSRSFNPVTYPPPLSRGAAGAAIYDEGLRRHMLGVYRNMALGLGITALVALLIASTPALYQPIFGTPLKWVESTMSTGPRISAGASTTAA